MEDSNKFSYFLLGLGIGVAAGLLFAPQSGEETRGIIRSKTDEGKDYLRNRGEELRGQAEELVDRGREAMHRQKEQLSAAVDAGKRAYRETVTEAGQS